jgi:hypothetical protein
MESPPYSATRGLGPSPSFSAVGGLGLSSRFARTTRTSWASTVPPLSTEHEALQSAKEMVAGLVLRGKAVAGKRF